MGIEKLLAEQLVVAPFEGVVSDRRVFAHVSFYIRTVGYEYNIGLLLITASWM